MSTTISRFAGLKNCSAGFNMPVGSSHSPFVQVSGVTSSKGNSLDGIGASLGANTSFTIEFWMMAAVPPTSEAGILTWGSVSTVGNNVYFPWSIYVNSPSVQTTSGLKTVTVSAVRKGLNGTTARSETSTTPNAITCAVWHHVAFIRGFNATPGNAQAAGTTSVYWNVVVDGVLATPGSSGNPPGPAPTTITTSNQASSAAPTGSSVYFGSENGSSASFQGLLSQVRIWDNALSVAQVQTLMNHSLHGRASLPFHGDSGATSVNLLANWQGGEGFGSQLYDVAGLNHGNWKVQGTSGLVDAPGVWMALLPPRPPAMPSSIVGS